MTVSLKMVCFIVYCVLYTLLFRRLLPHSSEVTLVSQTGENGPTNDKVGVSSERISTLPKTAVLSERKQ